MGGDVPSIRPAASDARRVTFGLVPAHQGDESRLALKDLCDLLGDDTGISVAPHCAPSPTALASAMQGDRVQLAWVSPTLLLLSDQLDHVVPLLSSVRQGVAFYHAVLYVRDDSPIRGPHDLASARVAWVAPTSAAGYLVPRASLARQRIDATRLFRDEVFCDSHGGVTRAVAEGRADVGATYAVFEGGDPRRPLVRAGFREGVRGGEFRIIDTAGPIPSDMIVAAAAVPLSWRATLAGALCRLAADPVGRVPILKLIGADEFRPFSHTSLQELQALVKAASGG